MNKKQSRRRRDIKSKLMAAICMLLVSSIMMVSTTYAWFTLSTAPEVTGITTAVGANGNLEMALIPAEADLSALDDPQVIKSAAGDSKDAAGKLLKDANITWGNLVDLQDNNTYGLDKISLYPAALNYGDDAETTIDASPLKRPVYGVDGRVADLKADTITNTFASGSFSIEGNYGVRAVGTSSSMSARELEHRSLLSTASSKTSAAKSVASGSLADHGDTLASMAIRKVNDDAVTYTADDVDALLAVVTSMETALANIETAIRNYVAANNIAPADKETSYQNIVTDILETKTLEQIGAADSGYTVPATYPTAIAKLAIEKTNVSTAKTTLQNCKNNGTYGWDDVSPALTKIVDPDAMKINGVAAGNAMNQVQDILDYMLDNGGIHLAMATGSGVFASIADFCGDYSTFIILPENSSITAGGITANLSGRKAVMKTETTVNSAYLVGFNQTKTAFVAANGTGAEKIISDFYGYIIDLAFRTNVADSYLRLQTEAENRIYDGNTENEAVMGHGSTMTFTSAADGFGEESIVELMNSLRIIFFETNGNAILCEARLDTATAKVESGQVTAKMYLYKNGALAKEEGEGTNIVELEQNTAKAVSVLVYLDGEEVTNADVANGAQSMTGSMNLQFCSSANLVPMNYSDLKQGEGTAATNTTVTLTKVSADDATKNADISVGNARSMTYSGKNYIGFTLSGNVPANPVVTVAVNGAAAVEATPMVVGGMSGYAIEYAGDNLTAETPIVVSVTAGAATNTNTQQETPSGEESGT